MNTSAIYKIQSILKPEKVYIGSAVNYSKRKYSHLYELRRNKHHSKILQNHYNKYGESDLHFSVLLGCEKEDLIRNEQFFIDSYNPYFNICRTAGSCMGNKNLLGFNFSEESKEKMRQSHLGIKFSKERKDKMSKSMKGIKKPPFTIEHRNNIGIAAKNNANNKGSHWSLSEETKKKIGDARRGKRLSDETKKKMKSSWIIRKLNNTKVA